jgi:hypothetical protein
MIVLAFLLVSRGPLAAQSSQTASPVAENAAASHPAPELADLIPLATALSDRFAKLNSTLKELPDLSDVEKSLSGISTTLEAYAIELQKLSASKACNVGQLIRIKAEITSEADVLARVSDALTEEVRKLGHARQAWLAEKKRWQAWQSSLLNDEPLDTLASSRKNGSQVTYPFHLWEESSRWLMTSLFPHREPTPVRSGRAQNRAS